MNLLNSEQVYLAKFPDLKALTHRHENQVMTRLHKELKTLAAHIHPFLPICAPLYTHLLACVNTGTVDSVNSRKALVFLRIQAYSNLL